MAKALIIAEKPSVGRDIAAALPGAFVRKDNYLEGDRVVISWAIGHLVRLYTPDEYSDAWKKWRMEDLPMVPDAFKLRGASPKTAGQLKTLTALLKRADIAQVVNACDAGREGELIFRYIMQHARCTKPVKRLWLASMTPQAITDGLKTMADGSDYDALADAARSRSEADWLVGMNASRAATIVLRDALGGACSVGRVQTPTLALLVRRELTIRDFVPEDYWVVEAQFATVSDAGARTYAGSYRDGHRFKAEDDAVAIADAVRGRAGTITLVDAKQIAEKAPALYDLTTLQREASKAFGFTAAKTLEIAQALYETHKVLTYPRTDSRWLPADQGARLPQLLAALPASYQAYASSLTAQPLALAQVVDDSKVKDHYAIIPTEQAPSGLSKDEQALYDMVVRRLLAALSPASQIQRTRVESTVEGHVFVTKGRVVLAPGWRAAYAGATWFTTEETDLPALTQGEAIDTPEVGVLAKQTQPPKRYTDAGLLGAMETAGKLVDDDAAREAMKESGLGTPATRAATIERLISAGYVNREKKALVPSEKGVRLIELLEEHPVTQAALTGDWERQLRLMEQGAADRQQFMDGMVAFAGQIVEDVAALAPKVAELYPPADDRPAVGVCPGCGKPVREGLKSYSCWTRADKGCGFAIWKTIAKRKIPKGAVKELLSAGQTTKAVDGFTSRAGKKFDARLKLEQDPAGKWAVNFVFEQRTST